MSACASPPANDPVAAEYPASWNVVFSPSKALPDTYEFGHKTTTLTKGQTFPPAAMPLACDISWERDIPVTLRDGTEIYVDVLRPDTAGKVPAIVAWSPYGKTIPAETILPTVPAYWQSGLAKSEGPDPGFWACNGYAVVNVDPRGVGRSNGDIHFWGSVDAHDGYDVIEWIAAQDWNTGKVAMHGTSWLAVAQWFIAATRPPHLAAIAPWNGFTDVYRDHLAIGGIPSTEFAAAAGGSLAGAHRTEAPDRMLSANDGLWSDYWQDKSANLENINVPAYIVADGATLLHRGGSTEGFRRLGSTEKWLRIDDTDEWYDQYDPRNEVDLLRFFDHYLKGVNNGWQTTPRVRVAILDGGGTNKPNVPYSDWPLPDTDYRKFYLDAANHSLSGAPSVEQQVSYDARTGQTTFTVTFSKDTQITGYLKARLYVEAVGADDMDLYLQVQKLDDTGKILLPSEQFTTAYQGNPVTGAPGQQRVSLRAQDSKLATDYRPSNSFATAQKLTPGEIVPVDVAILPEAQIWHAGQQLRLTISGKRDMAIVSAPFLPTDKLGADTLNAGIHIVHTGVRYPSYLQLPIVPVAQ